MKKGKFQSSTTRHIRGSSRSIALILAVMLLVGGVIGGTVAWLVDETDAVVNTFTYGDINITLDESVIGADGNPTDKRTEEGNEYEMVPGRKLYKDPKVTFKAGSEDAWLFVKVEEDGDADKFLTYTIAENWAPLVDAEGKTVTGVYYREVTGTDQDQEFYVLAGDEEHPNGMVTVKDTITKEDLNALDNAEKKPSLSFTAYAVQKENIEGGAAGAWQAIAAQKEAANNSANP